MFAEKVGDAHLFSCLNGRQYVLCFKFSWFFCKKIKHN